MFLENKLEIQIGVMKANPSILLSHTSYILVDTQGNGTEIVNSGNFSGWTYPAILSNCPVATPTVVLRREILQYGKFNEELHVAEDILLWAQIAQRSMILGIDQPLSRVRIHGNNAAYDYNKQLKGLTNIIRYGIIADQKLRLIQRVVLLAEIYWQFGYIYGRKREFFKGWFYATLAILCGLFKLLAGFCLFHGERL